MAAMEPWVRDLLRWFACHRRPMPWRTRATPYRVWISEIMLQQTQVKTATPYFERFVQTFPDVAALARARESEVLRVWQGLGYYTRARNLHACARVLVREHGGRVPPGYGVLRTLPGIGDYTAAAIASICAGEPVVSVDGNVVRVWARFRDLHGDSQTTRFRSAVRAGLEPLMPTGKAGDFNEALMELGALVCRPGSPDCECCPIRRWCLGYAAGTAGKLPERAIRKPLPVRRVTGVVIGSVDAVWLTRNRDTRLLKGLWTIPLLQTTRRELMDGLVDRTGTSRTVIRWDRDRVIQVFSHFRMEVRCCRVVVKTRFPVTLPGIRGKWVAVRRLDRYPLTRLTLRVMEKFKIPRAGVGGGILTGNRRD